MKTVYKLFIGDHYYYGSSSNVRKRITKHKSLLRHRKHNNENLQREYDKGGSLTCQVIIQDEEAELIEQRLINTYYNDPKCMNISRLGKHNTFDDEARKRGLAKAYEIRARQVRINGITYPSGLEASRQLGLSLRTVNRWITGERKCSYGWKVEVFDKTTEAFVEVSSRCI